MGQVVTLNAGHPVVMPYHLEGQRPGQQGVREWTTREESGITVTTGHLVVSLPDQGSDHSVICSRSGT